MFRRTVAVNLIYCTGSLPNGAAVKAKERRGDDNRGEGRPAGVEGKVVNKRGGRGERHYKKRSISIFYRRNLSIMTRMRP